MRGKKLGMSSLPSASNQRWPYQIQRPDCSIVFVKRVEDND